MVYCIICDYDLHGLDPTGNCPECGNAIARSMRGDLMRYADQDWLRRVERGMKIIVRSTLTILCIIAGMIGLILVDIAINAAGFSIDWFESIVGVLLVLAGGVALLGLAIGLWMMTEIEPRVQARAGHQPLLLRALSLAVVPMLFLWMFGDPNLTKWPLWLFDVIGWTAFITVSSHMLMFIRHLQSFDQRCAVTDAKRIKLLEKYRSQGLGCVVTLAILGMVVTIGTAAFAFGGVGLRLNLLRTVILIWIAVICFTRGTLKNIQLEQAQSPD